MTKKNLVVVAVFLAGLVGGVATAQALSRSDMTPCAVDMCRDAKGRCVVCPEW
jgi:hypothetical protein